MTDFFAPLSDRHTWYHVIGYAYAVALPLWPLREFARLSHLIILRDQGVRRLASLRSYHRMDLPLLVGVLERVMYVAAWLQGVPEFIGLWLALKVAGGWKGWFETSTVPVEPKHVDTVEVSGRWFFNTHLIGSAISLINAVVGALVVQWLYAGRWPEAAWLVIVASSGTCLVWLWARRNWSKASFPVDAA